MCCGGVWKQSAEEDGASSQDDVTTDVGLIHEAQKNSQLESLQGHLEDVLNSVRGLDAGDDQDHRMVSVASIQAVMAKERGQLDLHTKELLEHREGARATRRRMQSHGLTTKIKAGEPLVYDR